MAEIDAHQQDWGQDNKQEALQKPAQDELERMVAERTHGLLVANQQLQAEIETRRKVEKALRESEERYRSLVEQASDGIFVVDTQGNYLDINPGGCQMFGYTREEILKMNMRDLASPESQKQILLRFDELNSGKTVIVECVLMTKNSQPLQVEISAKSLDNGNVLGVMREITARKKTEQELQRTNNLLWAIIDAAPTAVVGLDLEGRVQGVWNPAAEKMLGWSAEEAMGRLLPSVPLDKKPEFQKLLDLLRNGQTINSFEVKRKKRDGSPIDYSIYASPLYGPEGQASGSVAVLFDITERKRMDEALWEYSQMLRLVLDNMPAFVFWKDRQSVYLGCNYKFAANAGLSSSEAINGLTDFDLPWRDAEAQSYRADDRQVMETGIPKLNYEETQLIAGGTLTVVRTSKIPLKNSAGEIIGVLGTFEDITERKRAEESLRRLNRELRAISNCNQTLLRAVDEQTLLNEICRIVCEEAGYRMAWVGYAEKDEACSVRPVAWAGAEDGYLSSVRIVWADQENGRGPTGAAIRTGESNCIQDFMMEQRAISWRENALRRGYRSNIALPLKDENANTFGALTIYSSEPNAFTPDEIRLLEELAGDLAFGITTLWTRAERKQADEALRESEKKFRSFVESASEGFTLTDEQGVIIEWNPASEKMTGLHASQVLGQKLWDVQFQMVLPSLRTPEFYEHYRETLLNALRTGKSPIFEHVMEAEVMRLDGPSLFIQQTIFPIKTDRGYRIGSVTSDITERKRAEEELRASEVRFRTFVDHAADAFSLHDERGTILDVNRQACASLGYSREELIGMTPCGFDAGLESDRPSVDEIESRLDVGETVKFETLHRRKDGSVFPVEVRSCPFWQGGRRFSVALARDVTERKRAEEVLQKNREAAEQFSEQLAALQEIAIQLSKSETTDDLCQGAVELARSRLGFDRVGIWFIEDDLIFLRGSFGIDEQGNLRDERNLRIEFKREGLGWDVFSQKQPVAYAADVVLRHHSGQELGEGCLAAGALWDGDKIIGLMFTDNLLNHQPIAGQQLEVLRLYANTIGHLITRKRVEEEIIKLNQELERRVADRTIQLEVANKELEAFSYSVSHDLRAPLRHINGFLGILQEHVGDALDEQGHHYLTNIAQAAQRMNMLIDDLLSFARMSRQGMSKAQVNLGELAEDVIQELETEVEGRDVVWQVAPLPIVTGDHAMLRMVLVNLLSNALKYTRPRLQANIEIGCMPNQEQELVVFVRDNGVGFDMRYADKLFGVFQRLHRSDEFEGTGIGLANVQRIINRHGGRVWAEAQVNQGATFYFSLPQISSPQG